MIELWQLGIDEEDDDTPYVEVDTSRAKFSDDFGTSREVQCQAAHVQAG